MDFIKKGLIISPISNSFGSYRLMCPTPFLINNEIIRIFLGFCDDEGTSRPGFIDVEADNPGSIIKISETPLLDIGENGMFDDNGLCPTSIIRKNNILYMYYFAFQKGVKLPFYMFSGLAVSEDFGNSWRRFYKTPVLDRTHDEPIMRSGPFVYKEHNYYRIYYPCGNEFITVNGKLVHKYVIHYAESKDGINWPQKGTPIISFKNEDEYGFGRPYVFKKKEVYFMLYSIRTKSIGYRLGFATSIDGINWSRNDNMVGLNIGERNEWDSEMLCYSSFIETKSRSYLFYNGNNLGATGFGYAELIES